MRLFSTLLLTTIFSLVLYGQNCAPGWDFYRTVEVSNSGSEALTDYQVEFQLNLSQLVTDGKLRSDGADLRVFSTDCTPLPFWGDSLGSSQNARIWVKLPTLAAGASTQLQVYYGKADASSVADGDNTFLFFDDFSSGVVDPAKWEAVGEFATFEVQDSILRYSSAGGVGGSRFKFARTVPVFTGPVTFDYSGAVTNSNGFGFSSADTELERILFRQSTFGFDTINQVAYMQDTISNGFQVEGMYPLLGFPRFAYQTHSVTLGVNTDQFLEFRRYANLGTGQVNTDTYVFNNTTMSGFHFILSSFSASQLIYLDNVRVRQVVSTPPATTVGAELMADPSSVRFLLSEAAVRVFPNPATSFLQVEADTERSVQLRLFDAQGRQVVVPAVSNPGPGSWTLSVGKLSKGVYYLQLSDAQSGRLLYSRKVMVGE